MVRLTARWGLVAGLLLGACSGGGGVNVVAETGLEEVITVEIEDLAGEGGEVRFLTVTDPEVAAALAAALDGSIDLEAASDCAPRYEVRFFVPSGAFVELWYLCDDAPLLGGEQAFWEGRVAPAPPEFVELIAGQTALFDRL